MIPGDAELAECPLCGYECESTDIETGDAIRAGIPNYRDGPVPNMRSFQCAGRYLLHHNCLSAQANTDTANWDPERAWWACKDLTRQLDQHAHFDQNCAACAARWAGLTD
jgi:hypothetical protein